MNPNAHRHNLLLNELLVPMTGRRRHRTAACLNPPCCCRRRRRWGRWGHGVALLVATLLAFVVHEDARRGRGPPGTAVTALVVDALSVGRTPPSCCGKTIRRRSRPSNAPGFARRRSSALASSLSSSSGFKEGESDDRSGGDPSHDPRRHITRTRRGAHEDEPNERSTTLLLERLLERHDYSSRLETIAVDAHRPLYAEAYLQGQSVLVQIVRIVADPVLVAVAGANSTGSGSLSLREPKAVIELIPDNVGLEDTTATAVETMTVDFSQITTVYMRDEVAASEPRRNGAARGGVAVNDNTLERALDQLYGSRVGRGRSIASSSDASLSSQSSGLAKKQVSAAVQQEFNRASHSPTDRTESRPDGCTFPAHDEATEHAERVLRQAIKIGTGSSRLVDSKTLAAWVRQRSGASRNPNHPGRMVGGSAASPDLERLQWAGQALANDAKTGGRFKRWPCVVVGCTATNTNGSGLNPDDDPTTSPSDVTVTSLSILNGGWLAVDQSVRAGAEARKFVERRTAAPSTQGDEGKGQVASAESLPVRTQADLRIIQRLECLAMGEDLPSSSSVDNRNHHKLEVDVRETLQAMNCQLSPKGATQALLKVGWWTRDISSEYSRVEPWSSTVLDAAAWFVSQQQSLGQMLDSSRDKSRTDLTRYPSLCIDAGRTKFRDDALGLRPRADTGRPIVPGASKWEVLVHIVDVSDIYGAHGARSLSDDHKRRLLLLKNASKSRGTSRYDLPLGPLHLMPPRVLEALSFSAHKIQRCVTFWAYMDERDGKILDYGFERTLVRAPTTLTYREASELLKDKHHDSNTHSSNVRALLLVLNRVLRRWSESHALDHEASRRRHERLATRQAKGGSVSTTDDEDDGRNGFVRSSGHILVDAALELYSTGASAMLRDAGAPIPQARGAESFRGGRVATAPLRRFVDGEAQRQVLAVLFNQGRRISAKECAEIGRGANSARNSIATVRAARKSQSNNLEWSSATNPFSIVEWSRNVRH